MKFRVQFRMADNILADSELPYNMVMTADDVPLVEYRADILSFETDRGFFTFPINALSYLWFEQVTE